MMNDRTILSRAVGKVTRAVGSFRNRAADAITRHENPYATHLPVLCAVAQLHRIRSVLELGCGDNSTLTFLNREVFPELQRLVSLENDDEWKSRLESQVEDSRLALKSVEGRMADAVCDEVLSDHDLILVDDSRNEVERSETIRAVVEILPSSTLLLVHDYEVPSYQRSASRIANQFVFDAFNPKTGIMSIRPLQMKPAYGRSNRAIRRSASSISVNDVVGWTDKLRSL